MPDPDHTLTHDICLPCYQAMNPASTLAEDEVGKIEDARRCCWCGLYSRDDLLFDTTAQEVPRHQRDPQWLQVAKVGDTEMFTPESDWTQGDPREVTAQ